MRKNLVLGWLLWTAAGFTQAQTLPQGWLGVWRGDCQTLVPGQGTASSPFTLELKIEPQTKADVLSWTMIYSSQGNSQTRPYLLKTTAAAQGHYVVDEGGGTLLDTYLVDNILTSHFEFPGNTQLTTRDELVGDSIRTEIFSYSGHPLRAIGNVKAPTITTHTLTSLQRCQLQRQ